MNPLSDFFKNIENSARCADMPRKEDAQRFIDVLIDFLFPFRNRKNTPFSAEQQWEYLQLELAALLSSSEKSSKKAKQLTKDFFEKIPAIYTSLQADAQAILQNDPAAQSVEEVILAYPGFYAIAVYRFANVLYEMKIPILPRLIAEHAHSLTGIDIHPGATVGESFFIDHGTGIVIGETTHIGNQVKIYQGVTLGALSVKKSESNTKRHPTIEDNVTIYSNSTILGGETIIGHDTIIGGNVFLTHSVEPFSMVYQKSEVKVRVQEGFDD
jgi:serine O-acetyltransferase